MAASRIDQNGTLAFLTGIRDKLADQLNADPGPGAAAIARELRAVDGVLAELDALVPVGAG